MDLWGGVGRAFYRGDWPVFERFFFFRARMNFMDVLKALPFSNSHAQTAPQTPPAFKKTLQLFDPAFEL